MPEDVVENIRLKEGFAGQRMVVIPAYAVKEFSSNPLTSGLYATDFGFFPKAKFHHIERQLGCGEFILIYCVEGSGAIKVNKHEFLLSANTYCIIPPHTPHSYKTSFDEPWTIYWLHFYGTQAENIYARYCEPKKLNVKDVGFDPKRIELFNNLLDIADQGFSNQRLEFVNMGLWHLLGSFLHQNLQGYNSEKGHNAVAAAILLMKEQSDKKLTIEEISAKVNCSESHLYAIFKRQTGYSPLQYFNHLKIQQSCHFLSFTQLSIKEISSKLGIDDPFYFSRLFRKVMGVSPATYRQKFRQLH